MALVPAPCMLVGAAVADRKSWALIRFPRLERFNDAMVGTIIVRSSCILKVGSNTETSLCSESVRDMERSIVHFTKLFNSSGSP